MDLILGEEEGKAVLAEAMGNDPMNALRARKRIARTITMP
jgi:hypothetical protein